MFYALAAPSGVSPHGVIFVPHFMREHGDLPSVVRRRIFFPFSGETLRESESNPLKSPKPLFVFARLQRASETLTLLFARRVVRGCGRKSAEENFNSVLRRGA
ncbi:hypothetical protein, partial [Candidatus Spyradosoma sp. SGI.093]|uniref:hypothetical protein n=1 Tax=Candidatus Spyradosoma sp. SGI.093 TaxID=3420583 RepID=UPI003D001104